MQRLAVDRDRARLGAEVAALVRTLRSYDVLTAERLRERSGACHWREETFWSALSVAKADGRIASLADGRLYELGPAE